MNISLSLFIPYFSQNNLNKSFDIPNHFTCPYSAVIRLVSLQLPDPTMFDRYLQAHVISTTPSNEKPKIILHTIEIARFLSVFPSRRAEMLKKLDEIQDSDCSIFSSYNIYIFKKKLSGLLYGSTENDLSTINTLESSYYIHCMAFWKARIANKPLTYLKEALTCEYLHEETYHELTVLARLFPFDSKIYHRYADFLTTGCGKYNFGETAGLIANDLNKKTTYFKDPLVSTIGILNPKIMKFLNVNTPFSQNNSGNSYNGNLSTSKYQSIQDPKNLSDMKLSPLSKMSYGKSILKFLEHSNQKFSSMLFRILPFLLLIFALLIYIYDFQKIQGIESNIDKNVHICIKLLPDVIVGSSISHSIQAKLEKLNHTNQTQIPCHQQYLYYSFYISNYFNTFPQYEEIKPTIVQYLLSFLRNSYLSNHNHTCYSSSRFMSQINHEGEIKINLYFSILDQIIEDTYFLKNQFNHHVLTSILLYLLLPVTLLTLLFFFYRLTKKLGKPFSDQPNIQKYLASPKRLINLLQEKHFLAWECMRDFISLDEAYIQKFTSFSFDPLLNGSSASFGSSSKSISSNTSENDFEIDKYKDSDLKSLSHSDSTFPSIGPSNSLLKPEKNAKNPPKHISSYWQLTNVIHSDPKITSPSNPKTPIVDISSENGTSSSMDKIFVLKKPNDESFRNSYFTPEQERENNDEQEIIHDLTVNSNQKNKFLWFNSVWNFTWTWCFVMVIIILSIPTLTAISDIQIENSVQLFRIITQTKQIVSMIQFYSHNVVPDQKDSERILYYEKKLLSLNTSFIDIYTQFRCFELNGVVCSSYQNLIHKYVNSSQNLNQTLNEVFPTLYRVLTDITDLIKNRFEFEIFHYSSSNPWSFLISLSIIVFTICLSIFNTNKKLDESFNSLFHFPKRIVLKEKNPYRSYSSNQENSLGQNEWQFSSLSIVVTFLSSSDEIYTVSDGCAKLLGVEATSLVGQVFSNVFKDRKSEDEERIAIKEYIMPDKITKKLFLCHTAKESIFTKAFLIEADPPKSKQNSVNHGDYDLSRKMINFIPLDFAKMNVIDSQSVFDFNESILIFLRCQINPITNIEEFTLLGKMFYTINVKLNFDNVQILDATGNEFVFLASNPYVNRKKNSQEETDFIDIHGPSILNPLMFLRDLMNEKISVRNKQQKYCLPFIEMFPPSILIKHVKKGSIQIDTEREPTLQFHIEHFEEMQEQSRFVKIGNIEIDNEALRYFEPYITFSNVQDITTFIDVLSHL